MTTRRKEKDPDRGPSKAYLVSFGDTMTTLLAFFIVLCSLAEDQTGANLYAGTGSFLRALEGMGLPPGIFPKSRSLQPIELDEPAPRYLVDDPHSRQPNASGAGPDANDDARRILDREAEELERLLDELGRVVSQQPLPDVTGEAVFDFFEPLNSQPPYLPQRYDRVLAHFLPLLDRPGYQVQLIVWATTPRPTAWQRAANQAAAARAEIATRFRLDTGQTDRLIAVGRSWLHSDMKRPVLSLVARKISPHDGS